MMMIGKLGYYKGQKFITVFQGKLREVDEYTIEHYKDSKDYREKEHIPDECKIAILCEKIDDHNRVRRLYNNGGNNLETPIIYGNSQIQSISQMTNNVYYGMSLFPRLTKDLSYSFSILGQGLKRPRTVEQLYNSMDNKDLFNDYYYFLKRAALTYYPKVKKYFKEEEKLQKPEETIEISVGRIKINNPVMYDYLENCLGNNDLEEFWNCASLDEINVKINGDNKSKKKTNKKGA